MAQQAGADAVGSFFAHADIEQPGFFEGVLDAGFGQEDEVQARDPQKGFNMSHLEIFSRVKIYFNILHTLFYPQSAPISSPRKLSGVSVIYLKLHLPMMYDREIPLLFSSMISGQRALDKYSRDRLFWHLNKCLGIKWEGLK